MSEARMVGAGDSLSPNQLLSGRYRVCKKIGEGGMGEVYLARDELMQRQVAIKLLRPGAMLLDAKHAKIFEEALTTAALNHRDIVKVYDVPLITSDPQIPESLWGAHYMVMEFVEGATLFLQLRDRQPARTVEEALLLWLDLVRIVRFAHDQGVIHRDLKPGNIIVSPYGVKVLDFGIAQASERMTEGGDLSMLCSPSGTPWYMRPLAMQAWESNQRIAPDKRDDIYALGVILYQMLAGELCHPLELEGRRGNTYLELPNRGRFSDDWLRKSCDALIVQALGLEPGIEFLDGAALEQAGEQLIAGWKNYQREKSGRLATVLAEQQLRRQEVQHFEQQKAVAAQFQRARRNWLFATAALSAVLIWGGIASFWYLEYRRAQAAVVDACEKAARRGKGEGFSGEVLMDLLTQLRPRMIAGQTIPASCVEGFNRGLLEPYGLSRAKKESLWLDQAAPPAWVNGRLKTAYGVAVAPDANIVAVGGEYGRFVVGQHDWYGWRLMPMLPRQLVPTGDFPIKPIALSADGQWLGLAYDRGRSAFLFEVASGKGLPSAPLPNRMRLSGLAVEESGKRVLIGTSEGAVMLWLPAQPNQPLATLLEPGTIHAPIRHLASLKNGILFIATDNRVILWSLTEARQLTEVALHVQRLLPHQSNLLEMLVQTARGTQRWNVDPSQLEQLHRELGTTCDLSAVLNDAPEAEEIVHAAKNSPFQPLPEHVQACYQVACQHLRKTSFDKDQINAACDHLEIPNPATLISGTLGKP